MHAVLIHGQQGKKENNIHSEKKKKNKVTRKERVDHPLAGALGCYLQRLGSSDSHTPGWRKQGSQDVPTPRRVAGSEAAIAGGAGLSSWPKPLARS